MKLYRYHVMSKTGKCEYLIDAPNKKVVKAIAGGGGRVFIAGKLTKKKQRRKKCHLKTR